MEMDRKPYRTTRDVVAYKEQEEGYAEDIYPVREGTTIFAVDGADKRRSLDGKPVKVVLFTIGTGGWYWMPRDQFVEFTEEFDVKSQTGVPFQP
jgi:hypothetical protein